MTVSAVTKGERKQRVRQWIWQLDLTRYDRRGALSEGERKAIRALLQGPRRKHFTREPWRTRRIAC